MHLGKSLNYGSVNTNFTPFVPCTLKEQNFPLMSQEGKEIIFKKIVSKLDKNLQNERKLFQDYNDVFSFVVRRVEAVKISFENSAKSEGVKNESPN